MADVINLNRARKQRARAEKAAKATENRIRFGRTRAEKAADGAEVAKVTKSLDSARREQTEEFELSKLKPLPSQ